MRKFDFDNLEELTANFLLPEEFWALPIKAALTNSPLNAPALPDPLFMTTNLTNGDDDYTTVIDGEEVLALDGNDIINISHDNVTVNGGAGDDVMRFNSDDHIFGLYGSPINATLDGGDGYDVADFQIYQIPGLDVDVTLDVRGIDFTDVEEISLRLVLHPTDPGPGGAGGTIWDDFFDINYSQLATLSHLDIYNNLEWEIHFTAADTVIDLRSFTVANNHGASLYTVDNVDKSIYLDTIDIFLGYLAAGEDTIYVTYDPSEFWRATFIEWEANTSGKDVLDFSLMTTVDDGMGGTLGTLTHEMNGVTQTGFGLANDSYIQISNIDEYYGWDGEDIFIGDSRDNYFDGNGGTDVAVYASDETRDYQVTEIALGEYTIEAIGGTGEGTDTLVNIETIRIGGINGTDYDIAALAAGLGTGTESLAFSYPFSGADGTPIVVNLRGTDFDNVGTLTVTSGYYGASYDILYVSMDAYQLRDLHTIYMSVLEFFDINFTGVIDTLDLSYVQLPSYRTGIYGTNADETVIANDEIGIEFYGGAGDDSILVSYDSAQFWTFRAYENPDDAGTDTVDFSQLGLVDDGAGGSLGLLTFDLASSRVTQTGFSLSTDSYAVVSEYDTFIGWDGADVFIGDERDNVFDGNEGNDTAVYSSSDAADYNVLEVAPGEYYVESLGTGEGTDSLTGVETIRLGGINGTDYAIGDLAIDSQNTRVLTNGDDSAAMLNGEVLYALGGNDHINVPATYIGPATAYGGEGHDTLDVDGEDFGVFIDGYSFENNSFGGTFNFLTGEVSGSYEGIVFSGFEILEFRGGGLSDTVTGGDGNDIIDGGTLWEDWVWDEFFQQHDVFVYHESDFLYGMGGDDILTTGAGNDILDGGDGNDILNAGWNLGFTYFDNDTIIGGEGLDTAVYRSTDITDYIITETRRRYRHAHGDRVHSLRRHQWFGLRYRW